MQKKQHLKIASSKSSTNKTNQKKPIASCAQGLKVLHADVYTIYLKTQNYHWNIVGPNFIALHKMLDEQWHDLVEEVDTIAERIRALDEITPATFQEFLSLKTISEGRYDVDDMKMLADLASSHITICDLMHELCGLAEEEGDDATLNMLGEQIEAHEKMIWMLKAHLM